MQRKKVVRKTAAKAEPKETKKVAEKEEFNIVKILSSVKNQEGKSYLTEAQVNKLLELKNVKGEKLITITNKIGLQEVYSRIAQFGFDAVYSELTLRRYVNLDDYIFSVMHEQKKLFISETLDSIITKKGIEGEYECLNCKKEGRPSKQTKGLTISWSGDEMAKIMVSCRLCGRSWITR